MTDYVINFAPIIQAAHLFSYLPLTVTVMTKNRWVYEQNTFFFSKISIVSGLDQVDFSFHTRPRGYTNAPFKIKEMPQA